MEAFWEALRLFGAYMGRGSLLLIFLCAQLYLFFAERDGLRRILFLYLPWGLLALFFQPWFAGIFFRLAGEEIYYRLLWLMPMSIVSAYALVGAVSRVGRPVLKADREDRLQKELEFEKEARSVPDLAAKPPAILASVLASVLAIGLGGSWIYANPHYVLAENAYHVPQAVVDICDAIHVEGREVMAAFPPEMLQFVRQYDAAICMPYGRESLVPTWGQPNDLGSLMESREEVSAEEMAGLAREYACHYIVVGEEKAIAGRLADNGYGEFARMHGYIIYKDINFSVALVP